MSARACIIPVFVPHLGCPHACVFCNQRHITGEHGQVTAQTVRDAIQKAAAFTQNDVTRQLAFYGGSFTAVPEELQLELLGAAKEALDRGEIDSIRLSTRPDAIDEDVLDRLRRFGVKTIELGAQSMSEEVLRLSKRGHSAADVESASARIQAMGFELILQMMTGLPGDTPERSLETARRIIRIRPDGVRIYPTVLVRDSELFDLWRSGLYREHTVEEAVSLCAKIVPLFQQAGIPVIRIGLNPTEELSAGAAAGGAYHPALGELVKSRILLEKAKTLLAGAQPGSSVKLGIAPQLLSQMIGQNGQNKQKLIEEFGLDSLKIIPLDETCLEPKIIL